MPKRALIVIDVQNEYFDGALPITDPPRETSLENIGRAMEAASAAGVPVIVVRHGTEDPAEGIFLAGSHAWELHPEIERRRRDFLIDKTLPGSFTDTELGSVLEDAGIDTVAITGYMTHMCVDTTSRQAAHRGLAVEILNDATGHASALQQRRQRRRRGAAPGDARRAGPVLRRRGQHRRLARPHRRLRSVARAKRAGLAEAGPWNNR